MTADYSVYPLYAEEFYGFRGDLAFVELYPLLPQERVEVLLVGSDQLEPIPDHLPPKLVLSPAESLHQPMGILLREYRQIVLVEGFKENSREGFVIFRKDLGLVVGEHQYRERISRNELLKFAVNQRNRL